MSTKLIRAVLLTIAALPMVLATPAQAAKKTQNFDLGTPEGATLAARRVQCSSVDGQPSIYWFHGEMFSRVPGEADRKLANVEGMNIRTCGTKTEGKRGTGWRLVSRELLFYVDPKTGELLNEWQNPWTGAKVKVLQTANDPVNQRWVFPRDAEGNPSPGAKFTGTIQGDNWWSTLTVPLFYNNPLGGDYQKYIGGTYHATEMFNFFGNVSDLTNLKINDPAVKVGWVRFASWLPWMEMGDRAGLIYIHAAGRKIDNFEQLPEVMKRAIATDYPAYNAPPPVDDTRPNETSWTYFKKKIAVAAPAGARRE
jgi:hypothetical protein